MFRTLIMLFAFSTILNSNAQGLMDRPNEEIFTVVEDMPIPWFYKSECLDVNSTEKQRCYEAKLVEHLGRKLMYPDVALEKRTEGLVVIRFVIDKQGNVRDAQAVKSLGDGCDEAAIKVVEEMPQWIPGRQRGIPVNVWYTLPIKFQLKK